MTACSWEFRVLRTYRIENITSQPRAELVEKWCQCKSNLIYLNGHDFSDSCSLSMPQTCHTLRSHPSFQFRKPILFSVPFEKYVRLVSFFFHSFSSGNLLNHMNHDRCRDYLIHANPPFPCVFVSKKNSYSTKTSTIHFKPLFFVCYFFVLLILFVPFSHSVRPLSQQINAFFRLIFTWIRCV